MQLRVLVDQATQYEQGLTSKQKIEKGRRNIFREDYEIPKHHKESFETNFIRHFYFKEIGFETEERFLFELDSWLLLNMPYWNKMYESVDLEYNPLYNVDLKKDLDSDKNTNKQELRKVDTLLENDADATADTNSTVKENVEDVGNRKQNIDATEKNKDLREDTPDDRLNIINDANIIETASEIKQNDNKKDVSDVTDTNSTRDSEGVGTSHSDTRSHLTSKGNNKDDFTADKDEKLKSQEHIYGKQGDVTYAQLIKEHREAILNIEKMIFDSMKELFMLIY